ncbi:MAG: hypothetical protein JO216_18420 [Hyphomicrobiales bacterium]|nr:hypothetical protein [Hyphomicrobiales bacterium]
MMKAILTAAFALLLTCAGAQAQNCGPLPNQLTNGTTADANQVMANFNSLLTCINNVQNNLQNNLQGYLGGLTLSNDAGTPTTTIDMTAGVAMSDDVTTLMKTVAFIKNANSAWSAGSGNGCLDTGTALSASTWYHMFVIERTDTGVVDFLCSTSATNPVFPTNYSKKRRIGSIRTDASSHILAFSQNGDEFIWLTPVGDANVTNFPIAGLLITLTVPVGVRVNALFRASVGQGAGVLITSPDENPQTYNAPLGNVNTNGGGSEGITLNVRTNAGAQVRAIPSASSGSLLQLATYGWIDTRGRFN